MVGQTITSAPTALKISIFSFDCLSAMVKTHLYPLAIAARASPIPVFPLVPSIMVPPGFISPSFSASSNIFTAILSFMELPGLKYSTFTNTSPSIPLFSLFNLTKGVFPIVSIIELYIMDFFLMKYNTKGHVSVKQP